MDTLLNDKPFSRFNPLNDYLFCKIMGEKGDEVQLLGFLNAVLDKAENNRLVSVEILEDKTFSAEIIGRKSSILDLRARLQDGTMINIEVQLRNWQNIDRRSLFYWGKEFTKSLKKGHDYHKLPNVIAINIVNFDYLDTENYHTVFHLREDNEPSLVLTDALEIHFINMVKYRRLGGKGVLDNPLLRWLAWFDEKSPPELVKEVVKMDMAILEANERMAYVTEDEDAINAYERRQMALADMTSMRNFARREGFSKGHAKGLKAGHAEGRVEGRAEGINENARKMKALGFSSEQIQEITGLSIDEIRNL